MANPNAQEFDFKAMLSEWVKTAHNAWEPFLCNGRSDDRGAHINHSDGPENALKQWTEWYEKEVNKLLNIPAVGILRNYQENLNQAVDKYNHFQSALTEFMLVLYHPLERSITALREDFQQTGQPPDVSTHMEDHYQSWVKKLEAQYMDVFQSKEYIQSLSETIDALNAFIGARSKTLEDILKTLPIPNNSDMDELYKEIYELKRRMRVLEKSSLSHSADA
jgi:class III poly(R)-hydroxyalkanoic acid synthase PhaE subunit